MHVAETLEVRRITYQYAFGLHQILLQFRSFSMRKFAQNEIAVGWPHFDSGRGEFAGYAERLRVQP